jgi:hypothetical protein
VERRRAARRGVCDDEPLSRARLRTGGAVRLVDVSSCGALAEVVERLLPGRHLEVHIVSVAGRVLVRALVVRAYVSAVRGDGIAYRAALAFDRLLDVDAAGYALPWPAPIARVPSGTPYPNRSLSADIEFTDAAQD